MIRIILKKRSNKTLGITLLIIFLGFFNHSNGESTDDYDIYSKLVQDEYVNSFRKYEKDKCIVNKAKTIVVIAETKSPKIRPSLLRDKFNNIQEKTIQNFILKNKNSVTLENKFRCNMKVFLVKECNIKNVLKEGGWKKFYEAYPDSSGLLFLSRIGFNDDKNQALVYYVSMWGELAAVGYYVLFELENGEWIEKGSLLTMIS